MHAKNQILHGSQILDYLRHIICTILFIPDIGIRIHQMACIKQESNISAAQKREEIIHIFRRKCIEPRPKDIFKKDGDIGRKRIFDKTVDSCRFEKDFLVRVMEFSCPCLSCHTVSHVPDDVFGLFPGGRS